MSATLRGNRTAATHRETADAMAALASYPGPVLQITAKGEIKPFNADGQWLIKALDNPAANEAAAVFLDLIKGAAQSNAPTRDLLSLPGEDGGPIRIIDTVVLPRPKRRSLVIGLDITASQEASGAAEDRYRALVDIAADFAWETGKDGTFTFLSADDVLGHRTEALIGMNPRSLLLREPSKAAVLPFNAVTPVRQEEIWVRNAKGSPVCLAVSALPIKDKDGRRCGTRGVCHDVTSSRLIDSTDAQRRVRERVVKHILDSIRGHQTTQAMLDTASRTIGQAVEADACEVFLFRENGRPERVAEFGDNGISDRYSYQMVGRIDASDLHQATVAGRPVMGLMTGPADNPTSAVLLWRLEAGAEWTDENELLLVTLREQIGDLIAQIVEQRKLETISRFDELTGLVNRRFFYEELDRRLDRAVERQKRGSLIYLDLDNFKAVNDTRGHDMGDAVLRRLGDILRANTREYDLIGRLGGDEFALWLDETDANVAAKRGEAMLDAAQSLNGMSASRDKPLAVSIGVAIFDPRSGETRDSLIARADAAMYSAKKRGKGRLSLAPSSGQTQQRR